MLNPRIPVIINEKPCVLAFDMGAVASLEEDFGIKLADLAKMRKNPESNTMKLLIKLLFAMTRSMDSPPTLKEIERMSMPELAAIQPAVERAMLESSRSLGEPEGETKAVAVKAAKGSVSRGVGGVRSPKRSTVSNSRLRNSGR